MRLHPSLRDTNNTIFLVDKHMVLCDCNDAYMRFACENDGVAIPARWGVGCSIVACLPEIVKDRILDLYRQAQGGRIMTMRYQCHAPHLYREYLMRLIPGQNETVISEHALVIERPLKGAISIDSADLDRRFKDQHGTVTQCCNCRKVRHATGGEEWSWVHPMTLITHPAEGTSNISHGLCPVCLEQLYPDV